MAENQVAVVAANKGSFPVATKDELSSFTFLGENALEIVRENLGEEPMSPNDFDRAKFPTGGGFFRRRCKARLSVFRSGIRRGRPRRALRDMSLCQVGERQER